MDRSAGVDFGSLAGKVDNQYVNQFVNERKEDLFFRKTNDWATEFEYRFVSTVPGGSYVYVDFEDALEFVMVSERFPHWQRPGAIRRRVRPSVQNRWLWIGRQGGPGWRT
ncbi:MAG: hypothetical protein H6532_00010 [Thermoleophilales bacterium]|nr:hypothetical protein [Thermoleophilales bacterium]